MSDFANAPLTAPDGDEAFCVLRLYVSGNSPRSTRAIHNLRLVCDRYLRDRYSLEVIDIYHNPSAAKDAQIIAVPTLIKLLPAPRRLLIGDLSDSVKLRQALEIAEEGEA
ncbi:MAG: circadian clock KaiB family protein [Janthinobacterium lividum]|uniref:circadian clock KaiB family protein n=1 Tax=Pseudomonas TaxID=286 RepID=UPI001CFB130D|nr:circadian clock KaiB family protein [Pseudomonas baltica]